MARDHANIRVDIWNDPDFRELTPSAQLLYLQLLSSATLTYAGVADWRPKRIAVLSKDRDVTGVEAAIRELEDGMYVVVDDDTEEVFIRSFLKWDGLMKKPNVAKAMVRAWGKVHSLTLKAVIVHELNRLWSQFPDWGAFSLQMVQELCGRESLDPAEVIRERVSRRVPQTVQVGDAERDAPLPTTNYLLPTTSYGTTNSALVERVIVDFESVWSSWPKKTEKDRAEKEYLKHAPKVDDLAGIISRFGSAYAATTEKRFIPSLAAWLHRKRWTDELPTSREERQAPQSKAERAWDFVNSLEDTDGTQRGGDGARTHLELRQ